MGRVQPEVQKSTAPCPRKQKSPKHASGSLRKQLVKICPRKQRLTLWKLGRRVRRRLRGLKTRSNASACASTSACASVCAGGWVCVCVCVSPCVCLCVCLCACARKRLQAEQASQYVKMTEIQSGAIPPALFGRSDLEGGFSPSCNRLRSGLAAPRKGFRKVTGVGDTTWVYFFCAARRVTSFASRFRRACCEQLFMFDVWHR